MTMKAIAIGATLLAISAGSVLGQVNGSYVPSYGAPLAVQANPTQFGDANLGQIDYANGSELDAAYASSTGSAANILFTGNVESNFNKLVVFIDNGSGLGQNQITGGTGLPGNYTGMKFDAGFNATHWFVLNGGGGPYGFYVDGGDLLANTGGYVGGNNGQSGGTLSGGTNPFNILAAINNSNIAGVTSGSAAGALSATTGVEMSIPLAALGIGTANFKVTAFINGSGHDFASNQWLGSLPAGFGNLGNNGSGGLSNIDLSQIDGNQYFTVPGPSSLVMLAMGGLMASRRRRG